MKKLNLFLLSVFLLFSFCIISQNNQTDIYAKAKAVKVKTSYKRKKNGNSYMVITGYTKKNKKVWSHTATSYTIAQAEAATYKKRKNKVYFFDRKKLKIYRLSNGKKIRQIKIPIGAGHDCAFDSKNNMYLTGYLFLFDVIVYVYFINSIDFDITSNFVSVASFLTPFSRSIGCSRIVSCDTIL